MASELQRDQFVRDMEAVGHEVEWYNGRDQYSGPAVRVGRDELQYVIRETEVKLQWESMGRDGLIIYPA